MSKLLRPVLALAAVLAVALVAVVPLAGAGSSAKTYNSTDKAFAAMMLPHHEGGVELGRIAAEKGQNADVRRLGRQIVAAQTREAKTLRALIKRYRTSKATPPKEIRDRDDIDMQRLEAASGTDFDRTWLDVISAHHMSAIMMAQMEVRGGKNPDGRKLARKIIKAQREELAQFNALTRQLGG